MMISKESKDTLTVRVTSVGFSILTLAIFKPLGIGELGWMVYPHLVATWVLGILFCYITEAILKYIVRMPASFERGVDYIIRRNLWFQLINTPLVALMVCVYFHFAFSISGVGGSESILSLFSYLTMLLIIVFCSFTIGMYWRFKFRSKYLAAELEEVRLLNEKLQSQTAASAGHANMQDDTVMLKGTTSEAVKTKISNLLYIESVGNYAKVIWLCDGEPRTDMLRATSKQMEEALREYPSIVRCHRAFLVNLQQVERVVSQSGTMQLKMKNIQDTLPVSRSNAPQVKAAFKN